MSCGSTKECDSEKEGFVNGAIESEEEAEDTLL